MKHYQTPRLYTPIDYGNLTISTDGVKQAMDGFNNTFRALGYKTKEQKQKELKPTFLWADVEEQNRIINATNNFL